MRDDVGTVQNCSGAARPKLSHQDDSIHMRLVDELVGLPGHERHFAKGETIYSIGGRESWLFMVLEGIAKSSIVTPAGKSCLLDIHPPYSIFGETVLISDRRPERAEAMTSVRARVITRSALTAALERPRLQEAYISWLTERVLERQKAITVLVTADCQHRLAFMLQTLTGKIGIRRGEVTELRQRITQEELAAMVGTTRSRVGHFLKDFGEAGILQQSPNYRMLVHEPSLRRYVAQYA